jgi:hypothetical protein
VLRKRTCSSVAYMVVELLQELAGSMSTRYKRDVSSVGAACCLLCASFLCASLSVCCVCLSVVYTFQLTCVGIVCLCVRQMREMGTKSGCFYTEGDYIKIDRSDTIQQIKAEYEGDA